MRADPARSVRVEPETDPNGSDPSRSADRADQIEEDSGKKLYRARRQPA
jgi:hypothetical protein